MDVFCVQKKHVSFQPMASRSTHYASGVTNEQCKVYDLTRAVLSIFAYGISASFCTPGTKYGLCDMMLCFYPRTPQITLLTHPEHVLYLYVEFPIFDFKQLCLFNRLNFKANQFFIWINFI